MLDIVKTIIGTIAFAIKSMVVIAGIYVAMDKAAKLPPMVITDKEYNRRTAAKQRADKIRLR